MHTLRFRQRCTRQEQFPLVRQRRSFPGDGNGVGCDLQFDIRRRYASRQAVHRDLVDVVDRVRGHVLDVIPYDSDDTFRTGVVLKIGITTGVTRAVQRETGHGYKGIDIHRVGHDTDGSMRLRNIIGSAAKVELHLCTAEVLYRRQGEPCIGTTTLTEEEAVRTAVTVSYIDSRIATGITEHTHTDNALLVADLTGGRGTCFKVIPEGYGTLSSDGNKRIAVRPLLTLRLYIDVVRSIPAMIRFQCFAEVRVGGNGRLIHDRSRSRVSRIHFRVGNQHVVRSCITFP